MSNYRATIIRTVTFLAGLYFFLEFILSENFLKKTGIAEYHEPISYGFIAVGAMAFGLGLINIFSYHGGKLLFRKRGWANSAALLTGLVLMMTFAVIEWQSGLVASEKMEKVALLSKFSSIIVTDHENNQKDVPPLEVRISSLLEAVKVSEKEIEETVNKKKPFSTDREALLQDVSKALSASRSEASTIKSSEPFPKQNLINLSQALEGLAVSYGKLLRAEAESNVGKRGYTLLNNGLFVPLGSAMFSLLGFYIAAAAYRAFRVRSFESFLMMAAAVLVMCGQISFTLRLYEGFSEIRDWLLNVPNSAAFRAISIGTSVAGLVLAIRMWFSIESGSFSKGEKE